MKNGLLNLSTACAVMFLISGVGVAQLTAPIENLSCPAIDDLTKSIKLDGILTETGWSEAVPVKVLFNKPEEGFGNDDDISAVFHTCWNNSGIYIAFEVTDDVPHNFDGKEVKGNNSYEFDNVEIFFNLDTAGISSSGNYKPDGIQLRFCRGLGDRDGMPGFGGEGEPSKDITTTETTYAYNEIPLKYALGDKSISWTVEAFIPWGYIAASGTRPDDIHDAIMAHKSAIGFDVSVADSDATDSPQKGKRDAQLSWDGDGGGNGIGVKEDDAWKDVRSFGILSLIGTPLVSTAVTSESGIEIYPNPATSVVNFNNLSGVNSIEIVNLLGQTVKTIDITGYDYVLPVSDLAAGNYFAIVKSTNSSETVKFIVK